MNYNDFYNEGFGFICKRCESESAENPIESTRSRLMREGEAESKSPSFSNLGLAKWADEAQTTLVCPNCKVAEKIG